MSRLPYSKGKQHRPASEKLLSRTPCSLLSGADSAFVVAQGHFQIMFSRQHCPLLQRRLSLFMKLMYSSGVWSYIVGALTTPTYILIPVLTVYAGIFPIVVSWWAAGEAPSAHPMQRCAINVLLSPGQSLPLT